MVLPVIDQNQITGKRVLMRGDIDIAPGENYRLEAIKPTIDFLLQQNCQVILCGHIGRPKAFDSNLTTKPIQEFFPQIKVLENLRFDPREEANDEGLAKELASMADVYVNEAFAASERAHASIVGVPKLLPHYAGFRLAKEIEVLSGVMANPKRPLFVIIGGIKWETKAPLAEKIAKIADQTITTKMLELTPDGKDTTLEAVDKYKDAIAQAGTIIWNGPIGKVEEFTYQVGTRRLTELITVSSAYKVVGGGDTIAFVNKLGLLDKFDWISTGGGSMLAFLAGEKLPGIEALWSE